MAEIYNIALVKKYCAKLSKCRKNYLEAIRDTSINCGRCIGEDVDRDFCETEIYSAAIHGGADIHETEERIKLEIKTGLDIGINGNGKEHVNGNGAIKIERDKATDPATALVEMNAIYATVSLGGKFRIMVSKPHHKYPLQTDFEFSTKQDFTNLVQHPKILVAENTKDGRSQRKKSRGTWWLGHPEHRHFDGIGFDPGKGAVMEIYDSSNKRTVRIANFYSGFAVGAQEGKHNRYLRHVFENVCGCDRNVYDYVIAWMASGVQNPGNPGRSSLSIRGKPGVGKGVFAMQYGKIFGRHFLALTNPQHITGRFNAHSAQATLIFADEAMFAGNARDADIIKTLVSEEQKMLEPKGVDAIPVGNYVRYIFSTNHDHPLRIEAEDRRYLALNVTLPNDMIGNEDAADKRRAYFAPIIDEMNNGGRAGLLHYLLQCDISNFNPEAIPQTRELLRQKLLSAPAGDKFVIEQAQNGCLHGAVLSNPSLARAHLDFNKGLLDQMKKFGGRSMEYETDNSLAETLKRWGFEKRHTKSGNVWAAPPLAELRNRLETTYSGISWENSITEWENASE